MNIAKPLALADTDQSRYCPAMPYIELVTALLGVLNIVLIIRRNVWNYPVGIVAVILFSSTVWSKQLYTDAALQIFFVVVQLYGWWDWSQREADEGDIIVKRLSRMQYWRILGIAIGAIIAWGLFLQNYTDDSMPFPDASIAMLSVAGVLLMIRRYIENWHYWIVVNIISIPTYLSKDLNAFAILYTINLILSVKGLIDWRAAERNQAGSPPQNSSKGAQA